MPTGSQSETKVKKGGISHEGHQEHEGKPFGHGKHLGVYRGKSLIS